MTRVWGCPFWTPCGPGARGTRLRCNKDLAAQPSQTNGMCRRSTKNPQPLQSRGEAVDFLVSSECHRDLCTLAQGGIQGDSGVVDLGDVLDDGET